MTYNVENLFDTVHDPGKGDHTFLPIAKKRAAAHREACGRIRQDHWREQCLHWDWNEDALRVKLERVAAAILQAEDGRGPDLLVLQEVENRGVLERLRAGPLAAAGYGPSILVEGDDYRGIDVAFLSRLEPAGEPELAKIPFRGMTRAQLRDSRGILRQDFRLPDGTLLTAFALHLPAPYHPRAFREQALEHLGRLLDALPRERMAVAAGDFNIPSEEDAEFRLLDRLAEARWRVSHRMGCERCRGSSYYRPKDSWSFLDMILLSRGLGPEGGAPWGFLAGSVQVLNGAPHQTKRDGTPYAFDALDRGGTSDHWPVILEIAPRPRRKP